MIATLKFTLPQEEEKHNLALNGARYYCVIEATLNLIRNKLEYSELSKDQEAT